MRYGAVRAVRGLSLEVKPGEIVGLIGPNGAGKSSTLHAIMGAAPVAAGDVRLGGTSLVGRSSEDVARSGVALVPEGRRIFAELTVEENLRLGLAARRSRGGDAAALDRAYKLFPDRRRVPQAPGGRALRRPAAAARDRARARRRAGRAAARRAVARARAARRRRRLRRARPRSATAVSPSCSSSSARSEPSRSPTAATCSRTASCVSPSVRRTRRTPTGSWRRTSHDRRDPQHQLADARRRVLARRDLRADGRRHRARLRRAAPRQLRLRPADHGRRVRARVRLAVELAGLGVDPPLLRRRARAVAGDGLARVPPAAHAVARGDARRDVRGRVPAAEHRAALVRLARQDRDVARVAEPRLGDRRRRHPQDLDRLDRRRGCAVSGCCSCC